MDRLRKPLATPAELAWEGWNWVNRWKNILVKRGIRVTSPRYAKILSLRNKKMEIGVKKGTSVTVRCQITVGCTSPYGNFDCKRSRNCVCWCQLHILYMFNMSYAYVYTNVYN